MAEWKKVIFSGSNAVLISISIDSNITNSGTVAGSHITGSFTGSFIGDGAGLTGLSTGAITTYSNPANDRIITSVNTTDVNSEANLTFNGTVLTVVGSIINDSEVADSHITGSFTGSFTGDGSTLTGVGGSPGGSDTEIQYNDGGSSFAGDSTFVFNKTTKGITATSITSSFKGSINFSGSYAIDHTIEGITTGFIASETITFGELVHIITGSGGSGEIQLASASSSSLAPAIALCGVATVSANNPALFLLTGYVRDDSWNWEIGQKVYLHQTLGAMTQSAPSNTGDTIQVVGIATHADRIYFNPSVDTVELG